MKSELRNYSIAIALVAVAAVARLSLDLVTQQTLSFATFYPAVLLAGLWGGLGPGILASVLSSAVGWYAFMSPRWTFKVPTTDTEISLVLFFGCAMLLVWIAESYRRTLQLLHDEEGRRDLLIRELHHRNKNTLAVSQTIVSQTLKGESDLARKINGRLAALMAANDILVGSQDQTARLSDIIRNEVAPYGAERVRIEGPSLRLSSQDARSFALVIHELATNAAKYGALSNTSGRVDALWAYENGRLNFSWIEKGGPSVLEPEIAGFGSQLIKGVASALSGTVQTQFLETGLVCKIMLEPGHETGPTSTVTTRPA